MSPRPSGGVVAVVGSAAAQALRQAHHAGEQAAQHAGGAVTAAARELVGGPPLGRLPQPGLRDGGEPQPPRQPEHRQLPHVLGLLGFRVAERECGVAGQRGEHRALLPPHSGRRGRGVHGVGVHGVGLRVAQVLHDHPQHLHAGVRSGPGALLQPVEHLGRDQRRHAGQAHLAGDHDRGAGAPPAGLVAPGADPTVAGPPALVRFAVGDAPAVAVAGAGRYQAGAEPGQGAAGRVGGELVHRYSAQHLARPVRAAQPVRARRPRAARHDTARHARRRPGRADRWRPSQLRMIR